MPTHDDRGVSTIRACATAVTQPDSHAVATKRSGLFICVDRTGVAGRRYRRRGKGRVVAAFPHADAEQRPGEPLGETERRGDACYHAAVTRAVVSNYIQSL